MSMTLSIDVKDSVSPALKALGRGLGDPAGLHEAIGRECHSLTRDHLIKIAQNRHATARKLGAAPSGHWGQAAEKTTMTSDATAATITVKQVGIGRALHDVTITPGAGKKWLTIPIHRDAYNQRAYRMPGLFFAMPKGASFALLGRRTNDPRSRGSGGAGVTWMYLLKSSVLQKQDRTLLPPDKAYRLAAKKGGRSYIQYLRLRAKSGGSN